MKRTIIPPLLLLVLGSLCAQEKDPEFPGGLKAFYAFIDSNLCYPQEALDYHIEGRVYISFTIEPSGYAHDPRIRKGLPGDCNQAAMDLVARMPMWEPGWVAKSDGTKDTVPMQFNIPVRFKLNPLSPHRVRAGLTSSPLDARFPGGTGALYRFLADNIDYPPLWWNQRISARIWIDTAGCIYKSEISNSDTLLVSAVEQTFMRMPRWRPAHRAIGSDSLGVAVESIYDIPIDLSFLASMKDTLFRPSYLKGSIYLDSQWEDILAHEGYFRQLLRVNDSLVVGHLVDAERLRFLMPRDHGEFRTLCNLEYYYSEGESMRILVAAAELALADSLDMMEHFLTWFNWSDGWVSELVYDYGVRIEKRHPAKFRRLMQEVCPEEWESYKEWHDDYLEWTKGRSTRSWF